MREDRIALSQWLRAAVIIVAVLAPVSVVVVLLVQHYLPVPFYDDWALAPLISADSLNVRDLFEQHTQHRHFFPKLILTVMGRSSGWNQQLEPVLSILFALISVGSLVLLSRSGQRWLSTQVAVAAFAASVFLFSPAQYDIWLWPWMIVSTMTTCLLCLAALLLATGHRRAFGSAIACCLIAGLTSAQGLFTWLALFPVAIWNNEERRLDPRRALVWLGAALASWTLYFTGYRFEHTSSIVQPNIQRPLAFIEFVAGAMGAPWTRNVGVAIPVGFLQLVLFIWAGILVIKRGEIPRALALLGVGAWAVLFAAASASARLQYGVEAAVTSRYLASSAVLPVAFFVLLAMLAERQPARRVLGLSISAIALLSAVWIMSIHASLPSWSGRALDRERGAICIAMSEETISQSSRCLELIYPYPDNLLERVRIVEDAGIRSFHKKGGFPFGQEQLWTGRILQQFSREGSTVVTGLVVDPDDVPNPGLIFFRTDEDGLWCCGFSTPNSGLEASSGTDFRRAVGWTATLPDQFARHGRELTAFVFLRNPDRLSRLDGTVQLEPASFPARVYSGSQLEVP